MKEIYTAYSPDTDMTFIMCDTTEEGVLRSTEVVGWYHGEPDDHSTSTFTGKLLATYEF